jgi:hypothetical protein
METFNIPCSWEMYGWLKVQAETLEDAIEIAEEANLPEGEYIDGSFAIDHDILTAYESDRVKTER